MFACCLEGLVHGLLGIPPKQVGITHDNLLTGTPCWRLIARSLCLLEPAICIELLTRSGFSHYPPIETDPLAGGLRPFHCDRWNGPRDQSRRCNSSVAIG